MSQVLIVDDSAVLRAIQARVLRSAARANDAVLEAHDTRSALSRMSQNEDIELILLDNELRGAADFVRAVRRDTQCTRVRIVLVSSGRGSPAPAMKAGADAFLARPFDAEALIAARSGGG